MLRIGFVSWLVLLSLAVPATSSAATFIATASLPGTTASPGNPVLASVDFGTQFASIESVCFEFTFQGDLLDPGDFLRLTPMNLLPSMTGPGFSNPGLESQSDRTLCLLNAFDSGPITSLFLDRGEDMIEIGMVSGSVTIADLDVVITGVEGAAGQLADLSNVVAGIGPGTSLADKVMQAQTYLAENDTGDACSVLGAFTKQVRAQSGKKIPTGNGPGQADTLIERAEQIKTVLGCQYA